MSSTPATVDVFDNTTTAMLLDALKPMNERYPPVPPLCQTKSRPFLVMMCQPSAMSSPGLPVGRRAVSIAAIGGASADPFLPIDAR